MCMRRNIALFTIGMCLLFGLTTVRGQAPAAVANTTIIEPYPLWITFNKTTILIFPSAIKSVDRGSRDVLAQKAKGVDNILLVKAGRDTIAETNLSVITSDGKLYSFLLRYSVQPPLLNLSFSGDTPTAMGLQESGHNEAHLGRAAEKIAKIKGSLRGPVDKQLGMAFRLSGLYIDHDVLYFQLELQNHFNISYDIEMLRFLIRDDQKARRTASQDVELLPVYIHGDINSVKAGSGNILVVAVPKFTIPDRKRLLIQLMESNGGRHLQLKIRNRTIVKAMRLTDNCLIN